MSTRACPKCGRNSFDPRLIIIIGALLGLALVGAILWIATLA
jgi:hypothetical protein